MDKAVNIRRDLLICLFLIVATLSVYWDVRNHDFVKYDDDLYVTENPHVQKGLTVKNCLWAFTTIHGGLWIPLTWISFMGDYELYGLNPGGYHMTNLLLHIANALLLFLMLRRLTGAFWRSAFVAGLFALHPLGVESVAWVTERKDVLSTFFWMLTVLAYLHYVEHKKTVRYLLVMVFFAMGLMAKPMIVTLPFVLLLLDYWPLGRFPSAQLGRVGTLGIHEGATPAQQKSLPLRLVVEKAPLVVLSVASGVTTFLGTRHVGGVISLESLPFKVRIGNALLSYLSYMRKMIWPNDLAVLYPHPGDCLAPWHVIGAALLLGCISVLVIRAVHRCPYLPVGWFWYLGTLVPVIGLVQAGEQAMADRFTYVPLIGLFIMISWGIRDILTKWRCPKPVLAILAGAVFAALMVCTWLQVGHWHNNITLFRHALDVTTDNYVAHRNLGTTLKREGRLEEAIGHFVEALRINPDDAMAHNNLGNALIEQGRKDEAARHYNEALRINPDYAMAHNNLGNLLLEEGRIEEAIRHYNAALRINPEDAVIHSGIGLAFDKQDRTEEAMGHFREALRINPDNAIAHYHLGNALLEQGRIEDAIRRYNQVLDIDPNYEKAHSNLGIALMQQDRTEEAMGHFREALRINPDDAEVNNNLGVALALVGKVDEAIGCFQQALRIDPDYMRAHMNLKRVSSSSKALEKTYD